MPYSFTQIEQDKTRTIGLVFSFLIGFYFLTFWLITLTVINAIAYENLSYARQGYYALQLLDLPTTGLVLGIAFVIGLGHWHFSTANLINKMLGALDAQALDKNDAYHQMFRNIIDEVSVATGGKKIEGVVIPTMAMNAFALSDFQGRHVIGTTEGVLARLSRAQIESIVGHEAAHIVSGDCLSTSVTSSLFALYGGMLKGMELMFRGSGRSSYRSSRGSGRGGGGGSIIVAIMLVYALLLVTKFLSYMVRMFISRQREYRADAIAVRLTRDPLSLAEALYAIGYHWRGQGLVAQEMEAIFIMNPQYAHLDEEEGWLASLFSTHPPMENRIGILLNMAHAQIEQVVQSVEGQSRKSQTVVPQAVGIETKWMVQKDSQWHGPFELVQMATFDWITPQTWIKRLDDNNIKQAYQDNVVAGVVSHTGKAGLTKERCPRCKLPLSKVIYEGTEVDKCPFCQGVLAGETAIKRIIIRQTVALDESVKRIAEGMKKSAWVDQSLRIERDPRTLLTCPKCNNAPHKMHRMFYTEVYRVEVDKCMSCQAVWFDKDELEVLQCLIEDATSKTKQ